MKPAACVLIVDDEPDLRELLRDVLTAEGLGVHLAGSAGEACDVACRRRPDMVVTDLRLPDGDGLELLDRLRDRVGDLPAVVVTGHADLAVAREAARRGCADFLTKPLDLPRLRRAIRRELDRRALPGRLARRCDRLLELARRLNRSRHQMREQVRTTGSSLAAAYRTLNQQFIRQEAVIAFQRQLLNCRGEDDVFKNLFAFFAERGGSLFGLAMLCDRHATLQLMGRFGMPEPDPVPVCERIAAVLTPLAMNNPVAMRVDPGDHPRTFAAEPSLAPRLVGTTFLCMPLPLAADRLLGLTILYRRGEQPFTNEELALAEMLAPSVAARLNDPHIGREAA